MWQRGVPRLDCARDKKQVRRLHIWTYDILGVNVLHWRKNLWHCWLFGAPQWFCARGFVPTCLRSWCYTSRQSSQLWNLQSPECQTTSPKWENTTAVPQFSHVSRMSNERLMRQVLLPKPTGKPPRCRPKPRYSTFSYGCCRGNPIPRRNAGMEMNEMNNIHVSLFTSVWKCSASEWTSSLGG